MCVCVCVCVSVALIIQHAKRTHHVLLSSVSCLVVLYLPTLSHKRNYFRKNVLEHKFVVLFSLKLLSNTFLILRRTERDVIKMY